MDQIQSMVYNYVPTLALCQPSVGRIELTGFTQQAF
jgi:hypothetical protein